MKTTLLRGVPYALAMDGWWLQSSEPPHRPHTPADASDSPKWPLRVGALIALIALADLLLWQVAAPGLALAVFGLAVLLAAWALAGRRGTPGLLAAVVLFLPAVERVQPLSFVFWLAGLVLGASWIALARWPSLGAGLRFLIHAPGQVAGDLHRLVFTTPGVPARDGLRAAVLGWLLPLGLGLTFLSLLIEANPLFESWLNGLTRIPVDIDRAIFWAGIAILSWPFLSLPSMVQRLALGVALPRARALPALFNAASVRRSLILFNAVFAVQTLSDIAVFSGGASLPEGMSYAEYAHRGAYPLLATALLAGVFAIAARGFTRGNQTLRTLLLIWMAQTLVLTISSLIRLDSYVSVYGLTHLRLAALVWMGVVAVGITLVIGQILHDRPVGWLIGRCAVLGAVTLYLASLTSFAATIAHYNLGHDVRLDTFYLCHLDSAALPAIRAYEADHRVTLCTRGYPGVAALRDWREWGFRDWRTARSLAEIEAKARPWPIF